MVALSRLTKHFFAVWVPQKPSTRDSRKTFSQFWSVTRPNVSHFCGLKNSSIEAWWSQTMSIKALDSQTEHKNNCLSVKAKFKLFFRQTSLHQNVKHLVGQNPSQDVPELQKNSLVSWSSGFQLKLEGVKQRPSKLLSVKHNTIAIVFRLKPNSNWFSVKKPAPKCETFGRPTNFFGSGQWKRAARPKITSLNKPARKL